MRRPLALAVPLAAVAAIALAGCGDSGSPSADQGMSATQMIAEASAKTEAQQSYHVALSVKGDATAAKDALGGQVGAVLSQPIDISGEGTVQKPGKASLDLSLQLAGSPLQLNVTKVGAGLYVSALGQAFELTLPPRTATKANVGALPSTLANWIADPQVVGQEDVDGVSMTHITGGIDTQRFADDVTDLVRSTGDATGSSAVSPQEVATIRKAVAEDTVDIWIGTDDMLFRRTTVHLKLDDSPATDASVRGIRLDLDATLSDFGTTQQVTPPAGARKIGLGDAVGALGA